MTNEELKKKFFDECVSGKTNPSPSFVWSWIELNILQKQQEKSFYCQRDIEGESICDKQCEHCQEYYKPIEKQQEKKCECNYTNAYSLYMCKVCKKPFNT